MNGEAKMNAVAFSPDGKHLATNDTSGRTRLWSLRTGKALWSKTVSFSGLDCHKRGLLPGWAKGRLKQFRDHAA